MNKEPQQNPFVYGKVVKKDYFFNRKVERERLLALLRGKNNILITGDRRIGKTSLLLDCFERIAKEDIDTFYFNLDPISSVKSFIERYGNLFTQKTTVARRAIDFLKAGLKGFGLDIALADDGQPTASISWKGPGAVNQKTIPEILNLPEQLAISFRRCFLICFDEFQIARDLGDTDLIAEMRAAFQQHDRVTYVFMGSETGILNQLFSSPKEKFFSSAVKFHLGPISREEFRRFIQAKFEVRKISVPNDVCDIICQWGGDVPAHIQHLLSVLWNFAPHGTKIISAALVDSVVQNEIDSNDGLYLQMWQAIGDAKDQSLLQRRARLKEVAISSPEFCAPLSMNPATVTRRLSKIASRMRGAVIHLRSDGYVFSDPFFEEWIRGKT